jgi:hypothetical protein
MWNYRIIKDKDSYGLYEVIYNDAKEICAHTEKAELSADSVDDLIKYLEMMLSDAIKSKEDVLEMGGIKFAPISEDKKEDSHEIDFNKFMNDLK